MALCFLTSVAHADVSLPTVGDAALPAAWHNRCAARIEEARLRAKASGELEVARGRVSSDVTPLRDEHGALLAVERVDYALVASGGGSLALSVGQDAQRLPDKPWTRSTDDPRGQTWFRRLGGRWARLELHRAGGNAFVAFFKPAVNDCLELKW